MEMLEDEQGKRYRANSQDSIVVEMNISLIAHLVFGEVSSVPKLPTVMTDLKDFGEGTQMLAQAVRKIE